METLDVLLSDKYAEFTKQVVEIAARKKAKTLDFKVVYEKFQLEIIQLDETVLVLQQDFEAWKKERELNSRDS